MNDQPTPQRRRPRLGRSDTVSGWTPSMHHSTRATTDEDLEREIEILTKAVGELGRVSRSRLYREVGARYWGPGRFSHALSAAAERGLLHRTRRPPRRVEPTG